MIHLFIPSPGSSSITLGPLELRAYGLMIALGVIVAVELARRRFVQRGLDPDDMTAIAMWAVPAGLVGARLYHVISTPADGSGGVNRYMEEPIKMLYVWDATCKSLLKLIMNFSVPIDWSFVRTVKELYTGEKHKPAGAAQTIAG